MPVEPGRVETSEKTQSEVAEFDPAK